MSTTQALFKLQSLYWESVYETCMHPLVLVSASHSGSPVSKPHWSSQPHTFWGLIFSMQEPLVELGPLSSSEKTSAVVIILSFLGCYPGCGSWSYGISIPLIGLVVLYSLYIFICRKSFLLVFIILVSDRSVDSCDFGMPRRWTRGLPTLPYRLPKQGLNSP